jgi:hypothetical protein
MTRTSSSRGTFDEGWPTPDRFLDVTRTISARCESFTIYSRRHVKKINGGFTLP